MFGLNISIEKIKDLVNLKPSTLLAISAIAWGFLLIPDSLADILGLVNYRNIIKPYIGIIALISSLWLVSLIFLYSYEYLQRLLSIKNNIKDLSPIEKAVLAFYIDKDITSIGFNYTDGVIMGLKAKGILYIPTNLSRGGTIFDFNLNPRYYSYLKKRPKLLMEGRKDEFLEELERKSSFNW